ncbi:MAG TPA: hypothetical protein VFY12_12865 [Arenimonas sp.]|nr:hypothetical protein [Arenimonas sp.]
MQISPPPAPVRDSRRRLTRSASAPILSLGEIERAVQTGRMDLVGRGLLTLLEQMAKNGRLLPFDSDDAGQRRSTHTRMAAAACAFLAHPATQFDAPTLDRWLAVKSAWTTLFAASGYGDCAHLLDLLAEHGNDGSKQFSGPQIVAKLLVAATLDTLPVEVLRNLTQLPASMRGAFLLGMLSCRTALSPAADRTRDYLIEHCDEILADYVLTPALLPAAGAAFMFCSYASTAQRHRLKPALNAMMGRWIEPLRRHAPTPRPPARSKPRLLVMAEFMNSAHSMYRCFGKPLEEARKYFEVIVMCQPKHIDAEAARSFDGVETVDFDLRHMPALIRRITKLTPDMLFYPSLGMAPWTWMLANLRLAPVQAMSAGHPASSFSPCIDYYVAGRAMLSEQAEFSEKVVALRTQGIGKQPPAGFEAPPAQLREQPQPLRIGVSSTMVKLNAGFLAACRRIAAGANRPLQWVFFPSEQTSGRFDALCAELQRALGDVQVHPRTDYSQYLQWLNDCDLVLGTFPFGGSNSNSDVYLLGKPKICLRDDEPAARTDERSLRSFELPDWMCADDVDGYVEAALRIIRDDTLRLELARHILSREPARVLFEGEQSSHPDELGKALQWILSNHDWLQAQPQRFFYPDYD